MPCVFAYDRGIRTKSQKPASTLPVNKGVYACYECVRKVARPATLADTFRRMEHMTDRLFVLVDYDNLGDFRTAKTLDAVIRHIESRIPNDFMQGISRVEVRLYGGWTTGRSLTRQAQTIGAEIQANFPATTRRLDQSGKLITRILTVAFARSGLFLPSEDLADTFMPRRSVRNVQIDQSGWRHRQDDDNARNHSPGRHRPGSRPRDSLNYVVTAASLGLDERTIHAATIANTAATTPTIRP